MQEIEIVTSYSHLGILLIEVKTQKPRPTAGAFPFHLSQVEEHNLPEFLFLAVTTLEYIFTRKYLNPEFLATGGEGLACRST